MLSFPEAFPALIPATADKEEVELLTYKRWFHGSWPLRYFYYVTDRPCAYPLDGLRHTHELMLSKLPCFIMAINGGVLACILA